MSHSLQQWFKPVYASSSGHYRMALCAPPSALLLFEMGTRRCTRPAHPRHLLEERTLRSLVSSRLRLCWPKCLRTHDNLSPLLPRWSTHVLPFFQIKYTWSIRKYKITKIRTTNIYSEDFSKDSWKFLSAKISRYKVCLLYTSDAADE